MDAATEITAPGYRFGPRWLEGGGAEFRLWAPAHPHVRLEIVGAEPRSMQRDASGWHSLVVADVQPGARYFFVLGDGQKLPDPASRFQPEDVRGASELIADRPPGRNAWRGRPWSELVIYELHVGAFTPQGTFLAIVDKLDYLAGVGVTAIELMPIADFPGSRGWGYDGVFLYAPEAAYGRPEDLRALVDAAHVRGISVLLDVVYNHFGPEGNHLAQLAPQFFTERHQTPWGAGINFEAPEARPVREFFVENALYWLREFEFDGLRLDAVHAIRDDSALHVLDEIAQRVRAELKDRPVHLILENEDNEVSRLPREPSGEPRAFTATWSDDVHHTLHVAATGEHAGYYQDYLGNTSFLARAIAEGFAFQGEVMQFRGRPRGEPSAALPPTAFVSFIQNHDQIGNRAFGERLGALTAPGRLRAIASIYLLAPQIPMLFMGEEWSAAQPFQYFCDFEEPLASAVRAGRRNEFRRFPEFANPETRDRIPDPQAVETCLNSKLDWSALSRPPHADWLRWYQRALTARRNYVCPLIPHIRRGGIWQVIREGAIFVSWGSREHGRLRLNANLGDAPVEFPLDRGRVIWHEGGKPDDTTLPPWSVRWTLADAR